ncbi:AAA family ATPase [Candidatus Micrarchaeota archaeon]|nr:AAA family ATPase [Candidatus Micrarchaeota archaeon]
MIIMVCGLPSTGKTYLAKSIQRITGAEHISSDELRMELLEKRTYSAEEKKRVYEVMFERAEKAVMEGNNVILDATFYRKETRKRVYNLAEKTNSIVKIIECAVNEGKVREWINKRAEEGDSKSEADFEVYLKIKKQFEPLDNEHYVLDTSLEEWIKIKLALEYIGGTKLEYNQTHISHLFLYPEVVFKIKKPVKFSFLDFSTPELRKMYCEEELRLNKRLSPEIYLDVVEVRKDEKGVINFSGGGTVFEHAVKMKRIDEKWKMNHLLAEGKVSDEDIGNIAGILADFHSRIDTITDLRYQSSEMVWEQFKDLGGVKETAEKACGCGEQIDFILEKAKEFVDGNRELFIKRQNEGRIKDCHGDLHSGNIFIEDGKILIFDCIEFNEEFRFIDTANEISFLAMDLDAHGRDDLAELVSEEYFKLAGDEEGKKLLDFYKCYRANVRAKVACLGHMQNPSEEGKNDIKKHLDLAGKYGRLL